MAEIKKIFTAKSIEEAKAMAAQEFGAEESKITFTVIEEPKKSLFGKVKGEAKVEASYEQSKAQLAGEYIKSILANMGIANDISIEETEDGATIEILGDTTGAVIGRRGETLDAIQYLVRLYMNKGKENYKRVSINIGNYREKRKATLEALAVKIANNAVKSGRSHHGIHFRNLFVYFLCIPLC